MKTIKKIMLVSLILGGLSIVGCTKSDVDLSSGDMMTMSDEEIKTMADNSDELSDGECINDFPMEELSDFEVQALLTMREEEFLARDVYIHFYNLFDYRIFDQISQSEDKHTNAIKTLLDRYQIEYPAADHETGVFINSDLQALYNELLEMGELSGTEALKVGATIEDLDIFDLQKYFNNGVNNQDITFVFENLKRGSENHIRAFVRLLTKNNIEYTPQYISQEEFDLIISSTGNNGQGNGQKRRNW